VRKPLREDTKGKGDAGYREIKITGLSAVGSTLRLHGTVRMPPVRYADQYWQVSLVGDEVVGKMGLSPDDARIRWYVVDGLDHREDATGQLTKWQTAKDSCRLWIRLVARAGSRQETWYGLFDLRSLGVKCEVR